MTEWFRERYVARDEHDRIVAYYAKLVAQLYAQVKELRAAGIEIEAIGAIVQHEQHKAEREIRRAMQACGDARGDNVITVDFRRRR